jgi:hypothetical protein
VFISYAQDDRGLAERIRDVLAQSGIDTTEDIWEVPGRRDWATMAEQAIKTSDVVVVLLSPAAASSWAGTEAELASSRDLDQRGAELIPVLAAPTELSNVVRTRVWIDLTKDFDSGVRTLTEQILAVSQVDFSRMSPRKFEDLVADLLQTVGFSLDETPRRPDAGVDLRTTYQRTDPFGFPETEVWLVETKLYAHHRVSVEAIRQLAALVALAPSGTRGLFVTNTQLTSVAREYVAELERRPDVRLRVLDGVQLKQLLRQFPVLVTRHFGGGAGVTA